MLLNEYLEKYGTPVTVFAKKIGASTATLYNFLKGKREIKLSLAFKIEDITDKQVTARELIPFDAKKSKKSLK